MTAEQIQQPADGHAVIHILRVSPVKQHPKAAAQPAGHTYI
jgi:hypothetical protein